MEIQLPDDLHQFVRDQVTSGRFASEGEVVCAALERLKRNEESPSDDEDEFLTEMRLKFQERDELMRRLAQ